MNIYYLYRHIRQDKNEVFYVGLGHYNKKIKYKSYNSKYSRAFQKSPSKRKNTHWQGIVKTTTYLVEIIFESSDINLIAKKEKEFISLYGRADLGRGSLCNFTDGGFENTNQIVTEKQKIKMSKNSWVKGRFGSSHHLSKDVYVYFVSGKFFKKFGSLREAGGELGIDHCNISAMFRGETKKCRGYIFKRNFEGDVIEVGDLTSDKIKKVKCFDAEKKFIRSFESVTEAAEFVVTSTSNISKACNNPFRLKRKGYYWSYVN